MAPFVPNVSATTWSVLPLCGALLCPVAAPAAKHPNTCTPAAEQVVVRFTYGAQKADWIYDVTKDFNIQGVKTASGRSICVNAIPKGTGDGVNEIENGRPGPAEVHATSPASDLYVNLINHEYHAARGEDLLGVEGFLVSSPVVLAAWEPVVVRLGGEDAIGWKELFAEAGDGGLRYAQANPERSNSGLAALVAQFFAGAEAAEGKQLTSLSRAEIDDPRVRAFVAKVHENVVQYGQSTGFFADKMAVGGPAYADAVVLYESDVIQANNHIRVRGLGFPTLVAVYPKEGTFVSNHPYAIVQRDWVDADEEEGARKYFEYLTSPAVQARALQYGLRPGVALELDRNLYARVWNADNGTKPFDAVHRFLAVPNGQVVAAAREAFRTIKNDALVYLVVDRSGSMNEQILDPELGRWRPRIDMAVESADQLVRRLQDRDRLALLLYDYTVDDAHLTPDGRPIAMTADGKQRLREALSRIDPKGGTAMRNAIGRAWTSICKDIKRNQRDRAIRIIVVLTDGVDNASAMSTDKLIELTGYAAPNGQGGYHGDPACKIPVFGIAFGDQADAESLRRISEAAGGETREGDSAEIRDIFERFGDLL